MVSENPFISVIIVNHNGLAFVDDCLNSIFNCNYPNFEIIFVDNASTDGSLQYVKNKFGGNTRIHFIENSGSFGPAKGRNQGIAIAKGEYIAFLDNDTKVDTDWLNGFLEVMENNPEVGMAQSKLLRMDGSQQFDDAGSYFIPFGFLSERARSAKDIGQFDYIVDIFSAKSASSIVRRKVLNRIGGFDEDYYMYLEETDLSWRVWLAGGRVVFAPHSKVYHAFRTPKKTWKYYSAYIVRYYGCHNYIATLIKNYNTINLIKFLPVHILCWVFLSLFFLLEGKTKDFFWILKAILANFTEIKKLINKRKFVQKYIREVKDDEIFRRVMLRKNYSYYIGKAFAYVKGKPF